MMNKRGKHLHGPKGYRGFEKQWQEERNDPDKATELHLIPDIRGSNYCLARAPRDKNGIKTLPPELIDVSKNLVQATRELARKGVGCDVGYKKGIQGYVRKKRTCEQRKDIKEIRNENEKQAEQNLFSPRQDDVQSSVQMRFNLSSTTIMQAEQNESILTRQVDVPSSVQRRSNLSLTTSIAKLHCIKEETYCCLYLPSSILTGEKLICATTTIYLIGDGILHLKKLLKGHMKVSVIKVVEFHKSMELPVPDDEILNLESTIKGFIQWSISDIARVPTKCVMPQHENAPYTKKGIRNETPKEPNKQGNALEETTKHQKTLQKIAEVKEREVFHQPDEFYFAINATDIIGLLTEQELKCGILTLFEMSLYHLKGHSSQNKIQWRNAMYDEYNALVKNGTRLLVPRPAGVNMVLSMWLFKHKFHADGTLSRYKARLVANGSNQQLGVDFDETFSPVVKPATIRMVLSLDVTCKWSIHQLNVKNDFLNGDLSKTVYMHQPPSFVDARQGSQVSYLFIYVDDIILIASSPTLLHQIIDSLPNEFNTTDLGALNYFLGISADRNSTGLFLSQRKYALQLLERAHMVHCTPSRTPVDKKFKLGPEGVCLYMHDPRQPHFAALKRILQYVRGTMNFGLQLYDFATTSLVGYTDADWAGCPSTRKSTLGYCVFLGDNLLSWSAKRQHTLSRSSAEVEYRGVANVVVDTAWLRNLVRELHSPLSTATLVYCDNVSAVYMSSNPVQHQQTKHIEIDIHFVSDMVTAGHVRVLHVPSRYQYDDIFTKGLPSALFKEFRSSLSVHPPPASTAGAY
nr:ribonuclease H-like domain-containing protein [Tanacetum cinerariifolium]